MATNPRRGKTLTTKIPLYTLSGGVGRQAPSKRLPSEAEELVNAMCSVERSIEKRPGTDLMPIVEDVNVNAFTGDKLKVSATGDLQFFWHSLSDQVRYLIAIDKSATTTDDRLFHVWYYDQPNETFIDQTPEVESVPDDVRAYLTEGNATLKTVTRGQNLVFLNPEVYAGYTSTFDETENMWVEYNLDGTKKNPAVEDVIGGEVEYKTALKVDPAQIAVFYDTFSPYLIGTQVLVAPGVANNVTEGTGTNGNNITNSLKDNNYFILQAKNGVDPNSDISDKRLWTVIATDDPNFSVKGGEPALDSDRTPKRIAVKDWQYPDSSKANLGQSLPTFNDLTIPPLSVDVSDGNNNAEEMLAELYDLDTDATSGQPITNSADGKVYYIQSGYLGQSPGYYLAKSVASPSFQKVRTPDPYSVFDKKRMPMQLEFTANGWEFSTIEWQERTSGDKDTNPGPTAFKNGAMRQISAIASFRNRLWFSVGDTIFSTRDNDFTNLWLDDPGLIVDTDPIDISASTNKYTPITAMVPFKEYMFVNTDADTQYELEGSENQITPFTASLQPMTFYSTAPLVDPLTLGNNIFFYDAERLYMYFGYGGTLAVAQEVSTHCPKYLPRSFGATAVAAPQDSILAVDADNPSDVYVYTTRYRGDQIIQNAFYQFSYEGADIRAMKAWDNYVYMVAKRGDDFFLERQHMRYDDVTIPRLDRKQFISLRESTTPLDTENRTANNAYFDVSSATTTIRLPISLSSIEDLVLVTSENTTLNVISIVSSTNNYTDIEVSGNAITGAPNGFYYGFKFTTIIQLSPIFLRDDKNNPLEGVLNLASMVTRHFNTGNYDVLVQRRGRPMADIIPAYEERLKEIDNFITSFSAPRSDTFSESDLVIDNVNYQGELVSKIMGFSDKTDIYILSDYFTPMNITNLEIRGKFKQNYSSII